MRIDHINIVVEDIKYSEKFYTTILGFEKTLELELNADWMGAITGFNSPKAKCIFLEPASKNCRIELLEYISPSTIKNNSKEYHQLNMQGIRHIALEVDDLNSIYKKAIEAGVEFISQPISVPLDVVPTGKVLCYLKAPDGVIIELAHYTQKEKLV